VAYWALVNLRARFQKTKKRAKARKSTQSQGFYKVGLREDGFTSQKAKTGRNEKV